MRKKVKYPKKIICIIMSLVCFLYFSNVSLLASSIGSESGIKASNNASAELPFTWDNASVYFLLTDRFNNGDTSNDNSYGRSLDQYGNIISGTDYQNQATFKGGDFKGITQKINDGYFNDLGINAIWLSAPYEQIHGFVIGSNASESFPHYAYHGYYVLDYTQTDANFGTKEEFKELVDTAHKHGIRIVMDIVINHAGYNTIKDMDEYDFGELYSGWENVYYSLNNLNNSTYHNKINYNNASEWAKWWGADWVRAGISGYTSGGSNDLTLTLDSLPDFKTESTNAVDVPQMLKNKWMSEQRYETEINKINGYFSQTQKERTVSNYLIYWLSQWVREYGVDGFRCDTAKHVELSVWNQLKSECVSALKEWKNNNPDKALDDLDFWMTGEAWGHGLDYDAYFTSGGFDSMINFEFGGTIPSASNIENTYLRYANSINNNSNFNMLTYISSHDTTVFSGNRIQSGSFLMLMPGGIQVYYGDETSRSLNTSFTGDHQTRDVMNWNSIDENVLSHWQKVGKFRNRHIAVGAGQHKQISAYSSSDGYTFSRVYNNNNISDRIIVCMNAPAEKDISIDVSSLFDDGAKLINSYDDTESIVSDGHVTFNSGENGIILIEETLTYHPDVALIGDKNFDDIQEITLSISSGESYSYISVDGADRFIINNGESFTIGSTAFPNDTVSVNVKTPYTHEDIEGVQWYESNFTFYKNNSEAEIIDDILPGDDPEVKTAKINVIPYSSLSAPYIYVWTVSDDNQTVTEYAGKWPGKLMTEKSSDGSYTISFDDLTEDYFVIVNGGLNAAQSNNIFCRAGENNIKIINSAYDTLHEEEEGTKSVKIRVKQSVNTEPYLYAWTNTTNNNAIEYLGAWPGKRLTEKDEDGFYIATIENVTSTYNLIVNNGGSGKTADILNLTEDSYDISVDNSYGYTIEKGTSSLKYIRTVENLLREIKQSVRKFRNRTALDYTDASWNDASRIVDEASTLLENTTYYTSQIPDLTELRNNLLLADKNLTLIPPIITSQIKNGTKYISGYSAKSAKITVTVGEDKYTTAADDISGIWNIEIGEISDNVNITAICSKNGSLSNEKRISGLYPDINNDGFVNTDDIQSIQEYLTGNSTYINSEISDMDNNLTLDLKDAYITYIIVRN